MTGVQWRADGLKIDAVCANGSIARGQNGEVLKTFAVYGDGGV